jgi:CheY-like chemotaxis protein
MPYSRSPAIEVEIPVTSTNAPNPTRLSAPSQLCHEAFGPWYGADNRDAAETLAELLRLHDIEVDVAYDGATAIKKLPSKPAVAFVDLNMPGATGYQVAEYVRNTNWGQDIVLVAVTGMYQAEDFAATKASGFDAHLVKPAVLEELVKLATMTRAQAGAWMQASESGTNSS